MTIKVTTNEIVDFGLGNGVQILELVHGGEFDHVETVGEYAIRLSLEQMLGFVCCDMRNGRKYVRAMRR